MQRRELHDIKLAIEWLKNAIMLFEKREQHLMECDYDGLISAHLHLCHCYLRVKAWNYALRHAEHTLTLHAKQQRTGSVNGNHDESNGTNNASQQQQSSSSPTVTSSHETYLARMYAAEALVHLNQFKQAIKHLLPQNFPHLTGQQHHGDKSAVQTPKSSKSVSFPSKEDIEEVAQRKGDEKEERKNKNSSNMEHRKRWRAHTEKERGKKEREYYLAVLVNLATTYICRGALEGAHKCIHKALSMDDGYHPAMRMLVYLHLRMGNNNEAIKILKHRRPIPVKQLDSAI